MHPLSPSGGQVYKLDGGGKGDEEDELGTRSQRLLTLQFSKLCTSGVAQGNQLTFRIYSDGIQWTEQRTFSLAFRLTT